MLHSTGHNALYTSKNIQNELIEICGQIIIDVKQACTQVMADEASDSSNKKQHAITIRYNVKPHSKSS